MRSPSANIDIEDNKFANRLELKQAPQRAHKNAPGGDDSDVGNVWPSGIESVGVEGFDRVGLWTNGGLAAGLDVAPVEAIGGLESL